MGFLTGVMSIITPIIPLGVSGESCTTLEYIKTMAELCIFKRVNFMSLTCYKQKSRIPVLKQRLSALSVNTSCLCGSLPQATGRHCSPLTRLARMPIPHSLGAVFGPSLFRLYFQVYGNTFTCSCCQLLLRKFCFCYLSCSVGFYAEMWKRLKHYDAIPLPSFQKPLGLFNFTLVSRCRSQGSK